MTHLDDEAALGQALARLAERDADIARLLPLCGPPPLRRQEPGFAGLIRILVAQQLSAHAARAILARLEARLGTLAPERFLAEEDASLRAVGLSGGKVRYGRALAEAILEGRLDLLEVARLDDAEAVARLVTVKGIGRWTAEIYLLFALCRPDVWPVGDLAVQDALRRVKGLDARPDPKRMEAIALPWRPWRSAAARFLWHVYRHPGVPG
jgi:DNA-3-methyladenine glycosylase II